MMYLSLSICLLAYLYQYLYPQRSSRIYPTINLINYSNRGSQIVLK